MEVHIVKDRTGLLHLLTVDSEVDAFPYARLEVRKPMRTQ
jgi:hypothetical protein